MVQPTKEKSKNEKYKNEIVESEEVYPGQVNVRNTYFMTQNKHHTSLWKTFINLVIKQYNTDVKF